MNRRQKIIVSITGIFIVLLALVGLTYGYYLTQIRGNSNDKSITVTSANLILEYGDGNNIIAMGNVMPGDPIPVKTFRVTNKGNDTVNNYKVFLDNVINELELKDDLKYTLTCKQFKTSDYEPWEKSTDENKKITDLTESGTCTGSERTTFPSVMSLIATNSIDDGYTHHYEFQLEYIYQNFDQSVDMGKKVTARINIYDEKTKSLASEILANVKANKNGTTLLDEPLTPVAESFSILRKSTGIVETTINESFWWYFTSSGTTQEEADNKLNNSQIVCDIGNCPANTVCENTIGKYLTTYLYGTEVTQLGKVTNCTEDGYPIVLQEQYTEELEKSMSTEQDDFGTSYYYRGAVEDNYLNFADMCWRIVRIQGDGSIKLILDDKNTTCDNDNFNRNWNIGGGNYGYDNSTGKNIANYLEPKTNADESMVKAYYDFQNTFTKVELSKLKAGDWCLNNTAYTKNDTKYTLIDKNADKYTLGKDFYYDSYVRLSGDNEKGYQPTLKCNGTVMDKFKSVTYNGSEIIKESPMYVGTLTADEMMYAGGKYFEESTDMYEYNYIYLRNYDSRCEDAELGCGPTIYSLSLNKFNNNQDSVFVWNIVENGVSYYGLAESAEHFRPSIILAPNSSIVKGDGTQMNPYVVG